MIEHMCEQHVQGTMYYNLNDKINWNGNSTFVLTAHNCYHRILIKWGIAESKNSIWTE